MQQRPGKGEESAKEWRKAGLGKSTKNHWKSKDTGKTSTTCLVIGSLGTLPNDQLHSCDHCGDPIRINLPSYRYMLALGLVTTTVQRHFGIIDTGDIIVLHC